MSAISIPCPSCGQGLKIRDRSLLGRKAKCPKCSHTFVLVEPATEEVELRFASTPAPTPAAAVPAPELFAVPNVQIGGLPSSVVSTPAVETASPGVGRLRTMRKKNSRRGWVGLLFTLFVLAGAGGGGYFLWTQQQAAQQRMDTAKKAAKSAPSTVASKAASTAPSGVSVSPTQGKPISLAMVPAGARVLLHLRPAELWAAESPGEEFRFCLGPLGDFLNSQIQQLCGKPAAAIEELLFAWIPSQRGSPPDLAVIVRLKEPAKKSELLDLLGGDVIDTNGHTVYVKNERAAVIVDQQTYATAPAAMAEDLVNGITGQNPMPTGIESLLELTDRDRHVTLLFEPTAVLLDAEFLAPPAAQSLLKQCMDWFADDAETVAWSFQLEPDRFFSELLVRNTNGVRPATLEETLRQKVDELAKVLLPNIQKMHPSEQGKRELIGRVPAMAKVVAMATLTDHGPRHVRLITPLPDRAAPNLALGTLLAWDESTRTDFSRQAPTMSPSAQPSNVPATLAERLQKKIDVDFRRTPLQEAFAYLGDETSVTVDIDGDGLKLAGYTQNMPQTFRYEQITGLQALAAILKNYDKMCLVLDEPNKKLIVTTYPVAEQKKWMPMTLPAAP